MAFATLPGFTLFVRLSGRRMQSDATRFAANLETKKTRRWAGL